eukprot:scaffold281636_cov35-Tisochrysis_lutea.AAC.3
MLDTGAQSGHPHSNDPQNLGPHRAQPNLRTLSWNRRPVRCRTGKAPKSATSHANNFVGHPTSPRSYSLGIGRAQGTAGSIQLDY